MNSSNEQLWNQFRDGDESCLRELIERHRNPLVLYINSYIHDISDAEGLMIEAFARIVARNPLIEENCFKQYLYKTGRNLALRYVRKHRWQMCFGLEEAEEAESKVHPERLIQSQERNQLLSLCMQKLRKEHREVLILLYYEGMNYMEAAKRMCKTAKQVDNLAYQGRKALRLLLEREGITGVEY